MSKTPLESGLSAVSLKELDFSYGGSGGPPLLSKVTACFPMGRTIAVMGRSGCGKSTLLNLIAGLERPVHGSVEHYCPVSQSGAIDFTLRTEEDVIDFRRRNIGIVFQRFNLLPDLTVFQNVAIAARLAGLSSSHAEEATLSALESVGMSQLESRMPDSLSGGEAQRLGIARAVVKRPQLLLADEPTGSLDFKTASGVIRTLISVVEQTKGTLVLVTHDSSVASNLDLVYELAEGNLALTGENAAF
jgi:putative ABC transport system ATP-binding protein